MLNNHSLQSLKNQYAYLRRDVMEVELSNSRGAEGIDVANYTNVRRKQIAELEQRIKELEQQADYAND